MATAEAARWSSDPATHTTLVIFSGPTDPISNGGKSPLYHYSLESFLQLGVQPSNERVTTAVVITKRVAYLAQLITGRGALVFYRRNVCYDMESVRVVLSAMETQTPGWRGPEAD